MREDELEAALAALREQVGRMKEIVERQRQGSG
jgi:hypothetical protein